jgi:hypothetical protein
MRLALCAAVLALAACGGPPRTMVAHYAKNEVTDVQAARDKKTVGSLSGVSNVVLDHGRDGTAKLQVYILDGAEAAVMPKVEELGYVRVR